VTAPEQNQLVVERIIRQRAAEHRRMTVRSLPVVIAE
jgi:hypothetical protein